MGQRIKERKVSKYKIGTGRHGAYIVVNDKPNIYLWCDGKEHLGACDNDTNNVYDAGWWPTKRKAQIFLKNFEKGTIGDYTVDELEAIRTLKNRGFAVIILSPNELGNLSPARVENAIYNFYEDITNGNL
jgi:hypothetical protein